MSDKILDSTQLISGIAVLLSFFAGYKYGLRNNPIKESSPSSGKSQENIKASQHEYLNIPIY